MEVGQMAGKKEAYDVKPEVKNEKKQGGKLAELLSKVAVIKTQLSTLKESESTLVEEIKSAMQAEGLTEFNNGEFVAKVSETAKFDKASLLEFVKGLPAKISKNILVYAVDEKKLEEAVYHGDIKPIDLEPFQVKGSMLRISKAKAAAEKPKKK